MRKVGRPSKKDKVVQEITFKELYEMLCSLEFQVKKMRGDVNTLLANREEANIKLRTKNVELEGQWVGSRFKQFLHNLWGR